MIYTSYFANVSKLPENCVTVAICGRSPDSYHGAEYKKLAPKIDFFKEWKQTHDNDMYVREYKAQVTDSLEQYQVVNEIINMLPGDVQQNIRENDIPIWQRSDIHIILLCYEKPNDFCHRHLVSKWLRQAGIFCREIIV